MSPTERVIVCGGARPSAAPQNPLSPIHLRLRGPVPNVHCVVEHVDLGLGDVPACFLDLIDVAAYVYAGDQAISRGALTDEQFGAAWRRRLRFHIPVRCLDLWSRREVIDALVNALSFLSEDEYAFEFRKIDEPLDNQPPLLGLRQMDEVLLFSGGLDSFGGAVQEACIERKRVVLVQHRSTEKACLRKQALVEALQRRAAPAHPVSVPIRINKDRQLNRDSTQRTRSFLFAALGASAAAVLRLPRLRMYENGVVALNLPPAAQVVGARASRTAHPRGLALLGRLLSAILGETFIVENSFVGLTKTEVLQGIERAGCADLIPLTNSCAHPREASNAVAHCGRCSQCIDRRFAVLAAGLEAFDPEDGYQLDLLIGVRSEGHPRTMLSIYVEMARRITRMRSLDFFKRYGEAARALNHLGVSNEQAAAQVFELYRRHAKEVMRVVGEGIARYHTAIAEGTLSPSCLVRLVCDHGAAVTPVVEAPRYSFVRDGECWTVRFAGQRARPYIPDRGFGYLHILVQHPGRSWTVEELSGELVRREGEARDRVVHEREIAEDDRPAPSKASDDPILNAEGRRCLTRRLNALQKELAALDQQSGPGSADQRKALKQEQASIQKLLRTSRDRNGRDRQLRNPRDRVRTRVCRAIQRSVQTIAQIDPALANHFSEPALKLGYSVGYFPSDGIHWVTAPE